MVTTAPISSFTYDRGDGVPWVSDPISWNQTRPNCPIGYAIVPTSPSTLDSAIYLSANDELTIDPTVSVGIHIF